LSGEGLEEGDLTIREELDLGAADHLDHAHRDAFSHQGDAEYRAMTKAARVLAAFRKLLRLGLQVSDVDRAPIQHRSARGRAADHREAELADGTNRDRPVMGDEDESGALQPEDEAVERLA